MARRMDREGVHRMAPQGVKNRRQWDDPRCKPNDRGWIVPFSCWEGWEHLNQAIYALRCVMTWRRLDAKNLHDPWRGSTLARIESDMRSYRYHLEASRRCDRPALP